MFDITRKGIDYNVEMDVKNKDCFIILPSYNVKKIYRDPKRGLNITI